MKKRFITTLMAIVPFILMAQSADPNIDVNLEYPAYGVNIKTNFAWQDGIWARGYRISNHDNTEYFIHFGAMGTFNNGISKQNYAYIGKDWNQTYMVFQPDGKVGIGTINPQAKLAVEGNILANEIKIKTDIAVPDYVFEANYDLKSLEEIESYVKTNKHLPEIPSAKQIQAEGLDVAEMNLLLLKKIEEMTLQLIQLNNTMKKQAKQIDIQANELESLKSIQQSSSL